jgi:hypothetical protein
MTGRHSKRATEIDEGSLLVHFSPEVRQRFARLEAAVCDSPHFAPEILDILSDGALGEPETVGGTIVAIAAVVRETQDHIHATGDTKTRDLLDDLIEALVPIGKQHLPPPVTVTKSSAKARGGRG